MRRLEAVRALRALAHVKALGDIYLEGLPGFEWPNMVSGLDAASAAYIKKHDPNAPTGRELGFSQEELLMLTKNSLPTHLHDPPAISQSQLGMSLSWLTSMLQSSTMLLVAKFVLIPVVAVLLVLLLVK